jgi:type IV fimbrial biogenesis protein FimT
MNMHTRGFTLIELLIAMAIFAFLIMLAGPMYANFMGNTQIRTAAENSLTGVRLAQTHAVRNNRPAKFVIDPTATTGGWFVYTFDENTGTYALVAEDTYGWKEGAAKTTVTTVPAIATEVTFDGLGRIIPNGFPGPDGTLTIQQINLTNTSVSSPRPLRVAISTPDVTGTKPGTKLCDPDPGVAMNDPRVCPP